MIDCSCAEITAINNVFGSDDVANETIHRQDKTRRMLDELMYTSCPDKFGNLYALLCDERNNLSPAFLDYFNTTWYRRKELWSKAFRLDAPFHTNNLIESYHNQLKTFYLGRTKKNRMDRTIYLLSQVVVYDYRQDALQVLYGVKNFRMTKAEKISKNLADEINISVACSMVLPVNGNVSNRRQS
ncbi:hypothetical protein BC941DRAFT_363930 [Chlamydoabsidia padenii]|nr:hypothetical protein BC941DRAFT_363930 [Chlamydoabsidia padenii]